MKDLKEKASKGGSLASSSLCWLAPRGHCQGSLLFFAEDRGILVTTTRPFLLVVVEGGPDAAVPGFLGAGVVLLEITLDGRYGYPVDWAFAGDGPL